MDDDKPDGRRPMSETRTSTSVTGVETTGHEWDGDSRS